MTNEWCIPASIVSCMVLHTSGGGGASTEMCAAALMTASPRSMIFAFGVAILPRTVLPAVCEFSNAGRDRDDREKVKRP